MANTHAMRKVSLRNLAAHKLRLALTALSVLLGTAFVAGSIIFTSTVSKSFNTILDNVAVGVDVLVTPSGSQNGFAGPTLGVPNSLRAQIEKDKQTLGVARVVPTYSEYATIAQADGTALQSGGAPSIASGWLPASESLNPGGKTIMPGGRAPANSSEVVLNKSAADEAKLKVGSKTKLVIASGTSRPMNVTVVGLVNVVGDSGGYVEVGLDQATASTLLSDGKHSANLEVVAAPGVSATELKSRLKAEFPQYVVHTGDEVRQQNKDGINQFLTIFKYVLLAFAAIGLIVGTFLIYNTFSMIVAQRVRELALLRAIGSSRSQVTRSVLLEAFIVGLVGGLLGLALGIGIAAGLQALLSMIGTGLPQGALQVTPAAVIACLTVGIVVTMVSAYAPARRAAKIAPVEAMREGQTDGQASLKWRTVIGAVFAVVGLALVFIAAQHQGSIAAQTVGFGGFLLVLAVVLTAPALSRPGIGALAVLAAPFGKIGKLARTNAMRNPRRTAATAFALTLGLMLVAVVGTLGSSFKGTIDSEIDNGLNANLIITNSNQAAPIPAAVGNAVATTPGVTASLQVRLVVASVNGKKETGWSPSGPAHDFVNYTMKEGNSSTIPSDGLIMDTGTANRTGWKVGQTVQFQSVSGSQVPVKVAGIYENTKLLQGWQLGASAYEQVMPAQLRGNAEIFVKTDGNPDAAQQALLQRTKDYLTVQVQTRDEFKGVVGQQINQMLGVLYGLLGLSLVIALLGIVNTLALSVVERKREIGMLRAVGMARAQVRRTIYVESVLIAIFGALLGVVLGLVVGWALVRTFREWGIGAPVIPTGLVLITLLGAAFAGVLAALWPAIRAARTNPLEAIADV